jgi:hypothetical protein
MKLLKITFEEHHDGILTTGIILCFVGYIIAMIWLMATKT